MIAPTSTKQRYTVVIVVQKSPTPQRFRAFLLSISSNVAIESHGVTGVTLGVTDLPLSPVTPKSAADMPLTDAFLRTLKPPAKPEKHSDSGGLFILATPNGGKWWRLKYRFGGKEKLLSMGTYPEVGLKAARDRRDEARALLAEGIDPGVERKTQKSARATRDANSFEAGADVIPITGKVA